MSAYGWVLVFVAVLEPALEPNMARNPNVVVFREGAIPIHFFSKGVFYDEELPVVKILL